MKLVKLVKLVLKLLLQIVLRATMACTFSTSQLPKRCENAVFCTFLTSKYSSRQNGVHFSTSQLPKSGPRMMCFVHFDVKMSFAPKRPLSTPTRVRSSAVCPFCLGNILRATTACTFSLLIWPAGSAPAALASLLFHPPLSVLSKFDF